MHCYFLSLDFQNGLDTVDSFYVFKFLLNEKGRNARLAGDRSTVSDLMWS